MRDVTDTLPLPSGAEADGSLPSLRLTVLSGPDRGTERRFDVSPVSIGRSGKADLCLRDPSVSQYHVDLFSQPDGILIFDRSSKNGVRVGPVRVHRAVVPSGSIVAIGSSQIRVDRGPFFRRPCSAASSFGQLVGESRAMRELYARLELLANADRCSIIIEGETGTGKDLAAQALHQAGPRRDRPFNILDCTRIPSTLAESALFGHARGAFTGAVTDQPGAFEAAHGGVLFLDEIGELPMSLQPQLLRVLETNQVHPIGRQRPVAVDVQVIAATLRDLRQMVNEGRFREDLYHRLCGACVHMPSLAERREDLPLLTHHFLERCFAPQAAPQVSPEVQLDLNMRAYPGNVRQLRKLVDLLALAYQSSQRDAPTGQVLREHLDLALDLTVAQQPAPRAPDGVPFEQRFKEARRTCLDDFERRYLGALMITAKGNLSQAARLAELGRNSLRDLLRKHGLYDRDGEDEGGETLALGPAVDQAAVADDPG